MPRWHFCSSRSRYVSGQVLLPRFANLSRREFGGEAEAAIKSDLHIGRFTVGRTDAALRKTVAMISEFPTGDR
jgi:hypothetical protein